MAHNYFLPTRLWVLAAPPLHEDLGPVLGSLEVLTEIGTPKSDHRSSATMQNER